MSFDTDFNSVINDIEKDASISDTQKAKLFQNISRLKNTKLNLMIVGGTGVGKSSTINALFGMEKDKVGVSSNPETMDIKSYELGNVILWDSPVWATANKRTNATPKPLSANSPKKTVKASYSSTWCL